MRRSSKLTLFVLILSLVGFTDVNGCGLSAEFSEPCSDDGGTGGGTGGGGGWGCQYCYTSPNAPYGNCYTADSRYGTGTLLWLCQGTRSCYRDYYGNLVCYPACSGYSCYSV